MRFLIITQFFPPEVGAAQSRLGLLARELIRQGHTVEVVTAFPNYPEGKIQPGYHGWVQTGHWHGMMVHRTWIYAATGKGLDRLMNYLSFMITCLLGLWRVQKPDWILVNTGPLFLSVPGWIYSLKFKSPMILNVADLWPRSVEHLQGLGMRVGLKFAEKLEAWSYKKSRVVNAVTEGIRKVLIEEKAVPAEKILFLPNAIDLKAQPLPGHVQMLRSRLDLVGKFVLVYPGNHGHAHALHHVLEAAEVLQKEAPNVRFILVGGGSDKPRLKEMAMKMRLQNVMFEGPVPPAELTDWINMADVGLVHLRDTPLAEETRPAKLFPLMAQGKAVIYSGRGEGARLINDSGAGWVLPPENAQALVTKILELRNNPEEIAPRGAKARAYAEQNFSIEKVVSDWLRSLPAVTP